MANPLVGDTQPFVPEEEQVKPVEDALESEISRLGNSAKWPKTTEFVKQRQEFYRRYLPGGKALDSVPPLERGNWWLCASTMISEYDAFMDVVNEVADAKRRRPPETAPEV